MSAVVQFCEWYAMCANPAVGYVRHPVLPPVPTCERCRAKHDMRFTSDKCPVCVYGEPTRHTCDPSQEAKYRIEMTSRAGGDPR